MQERQRNGAFQIKQYLKRQGIDVIEGKRSKTSGFMEWNVRRYNNKISKRSTPPVSQRAAFALRRALHKPTPSKQEVNKRFKEQVETYRKAFPNG